MFIPTSFTVSPFSFQNILKLGMNFPILTSFVLFFLVPLYAFLQRGMDDQKAILLASIIGYFMYFAFTTGLPDAIELYNILKSRDEENRRNAQKM